METATLELTLSPDFNKTLKEVAVRKAIEAVVGLVVVAAGTALVAQLKKRTQKPKIVVVTPETTEK